MTASVSGSNAPAAPRRIRSFVRRQGRITPAQARALADLGPRYVVAAGSQPFDAAGWFERSAPLLVEIGFGNGDALQAFAAAHPDWNCVGIEVYDAGVGALLNAAAGLELTNLGVFHEDAVPVLQRRFGPASIDRLHVFFPDPWPKARHHKRRLIQPGFVALVAARLRPGGVLQLATDWAPYAEHMQAVLSAEPGLRAIAVDPGRVRTRFEARGERLGHEVFDLAYERVGEPPG